MKPIHVKPVSRHGRESGIQFLGDQFAALLSSGSQHRQETTFATHAGTGFIGHVSSTTQRPKRITLIVACAENRIIGREGRLPFNIPEDKAWFSEKTAGCTVILGRVCFTTWPEATALGREAVVITRDRSLSAPHVQVVPSVAAALATAQKLPGEIMVCGGQRIYEETLPLADRLLLTLVHANVPGDTSFPEWRHLDWRETWKRESHDANFRYTFSILERTPVRS